MPLFLLRRTLLLWLVVARGRELACRKFKERGVVSTKRLLWVHTPKTGSSFWLALVSDCCPWEFAQRTCATIELSKARATIIGMSRDCGARTVGHAPLPLDAQNSLVVIVLREPRARLVSAYLDGLHTDGASDAYRDTLLETTARVAATECQSTPKNRTCLELAKARFYLGQSRMKSCVVKTLQGRPCLSNDPVDEAIYAAAERRLEEFYFVGIHEKWEVTVFGFHYVQKSNVSLLELAKLRSRNPRKFPSGEFLLANVDFDDPWDDRLYKRGLKLFNRRFGDLKPRFHAKGKDLLARVDPVIHAPQRRGERATEDQCPSTGGDDPHHIGNVHVFGKKRKKQPTSHHQHHRKRPADLLMPP